MEQGKAIRYNRQSLKDLDKIEQYISEKGYPETAITFTNRILERISTLKHMPERSALCKFPPFAKRGFRCSIFEANYIIVYKVTSESIDIKRVLHGKRLNY
jgi:addiction module RelE/StbE family toxin